MRGWVKGAREWNALSWKMNASMTHRKWREWVNVFYGFSLFLKFSALIIFLCFNYSITMMREPSFVSIISIFLLSMRTQSVHGMFLSVLCEKVSDCECRCRCLSMKEYWEVLDELLRGKRKSFPKKETRESFDRIERMKQGMLFHRNHRFILSSRREGISSRIRSLKRSQDGMDFFGDSLENIFKLILRSNHWHSLISNVLQRRCDINLFGSCFSVQMMFQTEIRRMSQEKTLRENGRVDTNTNRIAKSKNINLISLTINSVDWRLGINRKR